MLAGLIARWRQKQILRQCKALGMDEVVANVLGTSIIRNFEEHTKRRLVSDLYGEVARVMLSERGLIELREKIAGLASEYASHLVLCIKDNELDTSPFKCPELSAELHHHIQAAVPLCAELQELVWKIGPQTDDHLIKACNVRCAVILLHLNTFNPLLRSTEMSTSTRIGSGHWCARC